MAGPGFRLPHWTAHPGFGIGVLLVLAVALIAHGEPQPSSRASGRSVVVGSASPTETALPATLLIRGDAVQRLQGTQVRPVALPPGVTPTSVLTSRGYSVLLALRQGRQHAYGITGALGVTDLGFADGVQSSSFGAAAVVIERAVTDPGRVADVSPISASNSAGPTDRSSLSVSPTGITAQPRSYVARRYDRAGKPLAAPIQLPPGTRIAADTAVGMVVWKPVGVVLDRGQIVESLSAIATLIRPDLSLRVIGSVHPLAATAHDLLVWDVAKGEFGLMPLADVTSESTETPHSATSAAGSGSGSADRAAITSSTESADGSDQTVLATSASASPSTVARTRWFLPTRGFVVTGPASFSPDGSAFAAYGQVGNRRRLIVSQVSAIGTDQVEVLALAQPTPLSSGASARGTFPTGTSTTGTSSTGTSSTATAPSVVPVSGTVTPQDSPGPSGSERSRSGQSDTRSRTASPSRAEAAFEPEGFPILAPATPVWLQKLVVAVASDGAVIGYTPGTGGASVLDLGSQNVVSLAAAP